MPKACGSWTSVDVYSKRKTLKKCHLANACHYEIVIQRRFFFFSPELPILVCFSLYQLINLSESILEGKRLPRTEVVF